jgi:hypothetical protein
MTRDDLHNRIADRTPHTLLAADLESLACGDILACRIRHFYDANACAVIDARMTRIGVTRYAVAPNVEKLGMALFEATSDGLLDEYYADAEIAGDRARALYAGQSDPIDSIRAILERLWPGGCAIEQLHERPMYAGLVRVLAAGSELRPHQDNTDWDMISSPRAQTMRTQFSCNVYFRVPEAGGALELWEMRIDDEARYRGLQVPSDYALRRPDIGSPALSIEPGLGDLIVFDARRVHAVARVERGCRINASTFIGLRDAGTSLTLFS